METKWWHNSVVYQIYPRSFNDSNSDGIGDIRGIIEKLDYLQELGIDVIWISPLYKSPMDDNGYDISDYREIAPEFGTMEDMDCLLAEAKVRNIKIVMDLVVNHTSDEHPWFIESKSSKDNPKRDWYIWRDPGKDGKEPNNWGSFFTRSAWELDENTGQYYLHLFSKKQPDLNWHNPELRNAIYDMMHFWLKKGIAGFRMDVISVIGKPQDYPDATLEGGIYGSEHWKNTSFCHEYLREMNREVLSHYDILTVGETPFVSPLDGQYFSHPKRNELNMIFQFEHMDLDKNGWDKKKISLPEMKRVLSRWQLELHNQGWNSNYWSNHDQARTVSRFGNDSEEYRVLSAKLLGTTLHFLWGTPYIYQGEELGMTNTYFKTIEEYNDLQDHHFFDIMTNDNGMDAEEAMQKIRPFSRDNARVPMNWSVEKNAGFTSGTPWLPHNPNYKSINAESAIKEQNSVFHHYKKLIALRRSSEYSKVMAYGTYNLLLADHEEFFAYIREYEGKSLLAVCNFSDKEIELPLENEIRINDCLISNYEWKETLALPSSLRPYESFVVDVTVTSNRFKSC